MIQHIQPLYDLSDEAWDALRQDEATKLPTCVNHPGRPTAGGFDDAYFCHECIEPELRRRRLWLVSFRLVRGGLEALR